MKASNGTTGTRLQEMTCQDLIDYANIFGQIRL
jgi:hypothetical protein